MVSVRFVTVYFFESKFDFIMNKQTPKGIIRKNGAIQPRTITIDPFPSKLELQKKHNTSPMIPTTYTPKKTKQIKGYRSPVMGRHCSEDQFKDHRENSFSKDAEFLMSYSEEDLSQEHQNVQMSKSNTFQTNHFTPPGYTKPQDSQWKGRGPGIPKSPTFNLSEKAKLTEKRSSGGTTSKSTFLKDTSSTASAENMIIENKVPSFFKNKYSNKSASGAMEPLTKSHFKTVSKLGQGKFGKVVLVRELKTNFLLAMKIVQKAFILKENLTNQFIRQLKIQAYLDHPGIIKLYGFFHDEHNFYSLMELGSDGQLYNLIANSQAISQEGTSYIAKSLLNTIHYMHQSKVLHRDIKPQNIVLIHGNVKLCDFGWAVNKKEELRSTFCGTPLYFSPELLAGNPYDQKVDLWAIGILCFELHLCQTPFNIQDQSDLHKIVTQEVIYPTDIPTSDEFKQFIDAILEKDPKKRMTSKQLLNMTFIKHYGQLQTCEELCT